MAPKLRQLIHDFEWGRMDVLAHREKARLEVTGTETRAQSGANSGADFGAESEVV